MLECNVLVAASESRPEAARPGEHWMTESARQHRGTDLVSGRRGRWTQVPLTSIRWLAGHDEGRNAAR